MCEQSDESRDLMLEVAGPLKEERPAQSSPTILEHLLCKNRLQEYTQRSGIPLPIYQTVNEGVQHAPRFRSTVFVDGVYFTSPNTFTNRKAAERDVATLALDGITQKIKEEGYPLICQDTIFCKSILNEYAVKMSLERPTFKTIQPEGLLPVFVSSLVFNGVTYTGEAGTNKKEAEQLAARAVILSILGNSESGTVIFEIIKSKFRLYAALHKVKDFNNTQNGFMPSSVNTGPSSCFMPLAVNTGTSSGFPISKGKEVEVSGGPNDMTNTTIPETYQLTNIPAMHQQPFHEFKKPKWEPSTTAFTPIVFVPPAMEQPLGAGPSSAKKRNRKNKKKSKKIQVDDQLPVDVVHVVPLTQLPPCSVTQ